MKNLKIMQRLILSFLVVAVFTAIVGVIGVQGLMNLNENQNAMHLIGVNNNYVNRMVNIIQQQRIACRDAVLFMEDTGKRDGAITRLQELDATYQELHGYLERNLVTETSRSFLSKIDDAYENAFMPIKDLLVNAIIEGDHDRVYQLMEDLTHPIGIIITEADGLIDFAVEYSDETSSGDANTARTRITILAVLTILAFAGASVLGLYIARQITKPLLKMKALMDQVGHTGSLSFSPEVMDDLYTAASGKDEIHTSIASSLQTIRHFEKASQVLRRVADGDLTPEFDNLSDEDTIGTSLHLMLSNLNAMFSEIHMASSQVSTGAAQMSAGAQQLASGATEQAASIEEFTSHLVEMQQKTNHNAENSAKAQEANVMTAEKLDVSITSMGKMLNAMKAIDESSGDITKVIKVIDDIAFQTNILSLNAAVEAARAGQHGKGFAVVANEVRSLAAKSAEAAKETAMLIEGSSERVREGNEIVAQTNTDLQAAAQSARESTRLIELVADESVQQAKFITALNEGIEQISSVVQSNSATAEQSAAASEQISSQAVVFDEIVGKFKLKPATSFKEGRAAKFGEAHLLASPPSFALPSKYHLGHS